jgi:carbon-monoxide dehydrogenase large subunit
VLAGGAAIRASGILRDRIKTYAGHLLEASPQDIELTDGHAHVKGATEMNVSFRDIALAAHALTPFLMVPPGEEFGLMADASYDPPASSIANACHIAFVAVDAKTGLVAVERYVVVHDCGRVVNPRLVEGQIQGGVAQGLGEALFEEVRYDPEGQLLSATLMDYLMPTALDVPTIEVAHIESDSIDTLGGFKGTGESGVIGAVPAIACAVGDALAPLGVAINRLPLRPDVVLALIEKAGSRS